MIKPLPWHPGNEPLAIDCKQILAVFKDNSIVVVNLDDSTFKWENIRWYLPILRK